MVGDERGGEPQAGRPGQNDMILVKLKTQGIIGPRVKGGSEWNVYDYDPSGHLSAFPLVWAVANPGTNSSTTARAIKEKLFLLRRPGRRFDREFFASGRGRVSPCIIITCHDGPSFFRKTQAVACMQQGVSGVIVGDRSRARDSAGHGVGIGQRAHPA
jgi:hypothetical protein